MIEGSQIAKGINQSNRRETFATALMMEDFAMKTSDIVWSDHDKNGSRNTGQDPGSPSHRKNLSSKNQPFHYVLPPFHMPVYSQ